MISRKYLQMGEIQTISEKEISNLRKSLEQATQSAYKKIAEAKRKSWQEARNYVFD